METAGGGTSDFGQRCVCYVVAGQPNFAEQFPERCENVRSPQQPILDGRPKNGNAELGSVKL